MRPDGRYAKRRPNHDNRKRKPDAGCARIRRDVLHHVRGRELRGITGGTDRPDWIRVELVAGRSYDIRLTGIGFDGIENPQLRVFNSSGEQTAFHDDVDAAALDFTAMLDWIPAHSGVYYLSAGIYPYTSLNTTGGYRITITDEEDNHTGTPHTVSPNGRFDGTLDDKFDEDWIRVELVQGNTYTITLAGVGPDADTDTVLRLYDTRGEQVAFNDDGIMPRQIEFGDNVHGILIGDLLYRGRRVPGQPAPGLFGTLPGRGIRRRSLGRVHANRHREE